MIINSIKHIAINAKRYLEYLEYRDTLPKNLMHDVKDAIKKNGYYFKNKSERIAIAKAGYKKTYN